MNGPVLWNEILKQMPAGAIIAGGAVRDYLLGYEPKDIDVFVHHSASIDHGKDFIFTGPNKDFIFTGPNADRDAEYVGNAAPFAVMNYQYANLPVQVIYTKCSPRGHVDTFDIGLCQMGYDGEVHMSEAALTDMKNKTVTIINDMENAVKRQTRFVEKYNFSKPHINF